MTPASLVLLSQVTSSVVAQNLKAISALPSFFIIIIFKPYLICHEARPVLQFLGIGNSALLARLYLSCLPLDKFFFLEENGPNSNILGSLSPGRRPAVALEPQKRGTPTHVLTLPWQAKHPRFCDSGFSSFARVKNGAECTVPRLPVSQRFEAGSLAFEF